MFGDEIDLTKKIVRLGLNSRSSVHPDNHKYLYDVETLPSLEHLTEYFSARKIHFVTTLGINQAILCIFILLFVFSAPFA